MMQGKLREDRSRVGDIQVRFPGIVLGTGGVLDHLQLALLAGGTPPMVDQLVPGDPHQPRRRDLDDDASLHGGDGGEERLRGQILGQRHVTAPGKQVAVHLGKGPVVQREQCGPMVGRSGLGTTHVCIIAPRCGAPTGRPSDSLH